MAAAARKRIEPVQVGIARLSSVRVGRPCRASRRDPALVERCVSMVEGLREVAGGDIIPDAARAASPYRAGPEAFRTKLIEPTVPSVPGLAAYVGVLPKAEIPADFFEVVPRGDRLAVAIGDAPSLGLKSAFAARFVGNLFRRLVETTESINLADLLAQINSTVA